MVQALAQALGFGLWRENGLEVRSCREASDTGINSCAMTPEEAFARTQRRRRLTLATVIIVLVSLTVWVIELLTRAR